MNDASLEDKLKVLKKLNLINSTLTEEIQALKRQYHGDPQDKDTARALVAALDKAIEGCEQAFESGPTILKSYYRELTSLRLRIRKGMNLGNDHPEASTEPEAQGTAEPQEPSATGLSTDEKLVYARVYNKALPELAIPGQLYSGFMKTTFAALLASEKQGIAIYDSEENAKRSLKGERYGFVTLKIKQTQDVTSRRPARQDPNLGVPLLVVENLALDQYLYLTYEGKKFPISGGDLKVSEHH